MGGEERQGIGMPVSNLLCMDLLRRRDSELEVRAEAFLTTPVFGSCHAPPLLPSFDGCPTRLYPIALARLWRRILNDVQRLVEERHLLESCCGKLLLYCASEERHSKYVEERRHHARPHHLE